MKKYFKLLILLLLVVIPTNVFAKDVNGFYSKFTDDMTLIDRINGSAIIGANNVTTKGDIDGIGIIMGNNVTYNSNTSYGVLLGNNIAVKGNFIKDSFIFGNIVKIDNTNVFVRDVIIMANKVNLSGFIGRDATVLASEITFNDTSITGNIYTSASKITIGENVKINGTLKYNEDAKINKAKEAVISTIETYKNEKSEVTTLDVAIIKFKNLVSQLFILLLIIFITPSLLEKTENKYSNKDAIVKNIGTGLLSMIIIPIIFIVLLFSTISFASASIIGMFYTIFIMLSTIFASYVLGSLVAPKLFKKESTMYLKGFIGIIIYDLIILIPYIGRFVTFLFVIYGFGTLISIVFERKENKKEIHLEEVKKEVKKEVKNKPKTKSKEKK